MAINLLITKALFTFTLNYIRKQKIMEGMETTFLGKGTGL